MNVILLERIRNVGSLGEKVNVKPGYGRNYLIPKGKAVYATPENIAKFELRRAELEKAAAESLNAAQKRKQAIEALNLVTIQAKAGEEGKLFGSLGTRDIADAISQAGVEVNKSEVDLPTGPLRMLGEHEITLELHSDVVATIKISVTAEG